MISSFPKFNRANRSDFSKVLRERINAYLENTKTNRFANSGMYIKAFVMLALFFAPLVFLITWSNIPTYMVFVFYVLSGIGMAGIGMGVMHDAIHGSYSKHKWVNKLMSLTMNLIGANANTWKIQHNVLHHTYTNIDHHDEDIEVMGLMRFSPNAKRYWFHRFQHYYFWFLYGLSTMMWVTSKDFTSIVRYKKMGLLKGDKKLSREILKIIFWKILYFTYTLVLPMIFLPQSWWVILLAYLCMHYITGLIISLVFQTAHVMPNTTFPTPNENAVIEDEWHAHQLMTTTNFAPKSRIFAWYIGGLNFQVEHHLLPNICHVHYRKISKIVKETAEEYSFPYNSKETFLQALIDHIRLLRRLGKGLA